MQFPLIFLISDRVTPVLSNHCEFSRNFMCSKKVFIVEDDRIIAVSQQKLLEKRGYTVSTAFSGEEAVEALLVHELSVDIVLMDIDLGSGMDGTQAAAQILQHIDIPVLFVSSHSDYETVSRTETATTYGYVVKSTDM